MTLRQLLAILAVQADRITALELRVQELEEEREDTHD